MRSGGRHGWLSITGVTIVRGEVTTGACSGVDPTLCVPLIDQAVYVFERMFGWQLEPGTVQLKQCAPPTFDVSAMIRLDGPVRGSVLLSVSRETACRATSLLLQRPCRYLNDEIADVVRELTNTVVGRASGALAREPVRCSLPLAFVGRTRALSWPEALAPRVIELHSVEARVAIEFALRRVTSEDNSAEPSADAWLPC